MRWGTLALAATRDINRRESLWALTWQSWEVHMASVTSDKGADAKRVPMHCPSDEARKQDQQPVRPRCSVTPPIGIPDGSWSIRISISKSFFVRSSQRHFYNVNTASSIPLVFLCLFSKMIYLDPLFCFLQFSILQLTLWLYYTIGVPTAFCHSV